MYLRYGSPKDTMGSSLHESLPTDTMKSSMHGSPAPAPGYVNGYVNGYENGPIPVDSEPKSYPETVPPTASASVFHGQAPWTGDYQESRAARRSTICGVRRGLFWILVTAFVAVVIIAILAGLLGAYASGSIKAAGSAR